MPIERAPLPRSPAGFRSGRRCRSGRPAPRQRPAAVLLGAAIALVFATAPPALAHHRHHHHHHRRSERYIFLVTHVGAKTQGVPPSVPKQVRAEVAAAIHKHDALLDALPAGAPDPAAAPKKFKKYLAAHRLRAFDVAVDITDYDSHVVALPAPRRGHQVVVRIALRLFGETIPGKWMGFAGDGSSTIKVGTGPRVRDHDREYADQQAIQLAVADALRTSLDKLRSGAKHHK